MLVIFYLWSQYFFLKKKRLRSLNICRSSKAKGNSKNKDPFRNYPVNLQGIVLEQLNLSCVNTGVVENILKDAKLTPETISASHKTYGSGTLKYTGNEWYGGSVFVGQNSSNGWILIFRGETGGSVIESIAKGGCYDSVQAHCKVTQCRYKLIVPPLENASQSNFVDEAYALAKDPSKKTPVVTVEKSNVNVGKRGAKMMLTVMPAIEEVSSREKQPSISKLGLDVRIQGSFGTDLISLLSSRTGTLATYGAKLVVDGLRDFGSSNQIIQHIRKNLSETFNILSVSTPPRPQKQSSVPIYLRPIATASTTILNKLLNEQFTEGAQAVFLDKFVKELKRRKSEVKDLTNFVAAMKKEFENF